MANAIFTTKVSPDYDDLPEVRYHFPKTYYKAALSTVGDWILYYEPRREDSRPGGRRGRSVYFATARVERIEPDSALEGHFYAFISDYIEFTQPVGFRIGEFYPESGLRKSDGSTNKGRFGRAVRILSQQDYNLIVQLGFGDKIASDWKHSDLCRVAESAPEYGPERARILTERAERDAAFSKTIRNTYSSTCALTGLRIINGGGRCEIEAAHIRPIADNGPDSCRNGLALSRTVHWLFDRGIVSLDNEGRILAANNLLPEPLRNLLNSSRRANLPIDISHRPHPVYLDYHRQVVCKGKDICLLS